ncbi:hypothetical protein THASP1DRAFT_13333 [Thamnocephalis sphaerospora]|uniref:LAG1-DNAbind-domain-containing protein n=1 Tax=Thamnocephalis sphaerospora TaxID=78915 RepID=A0A4V1IX77_9FUNG|nr:hypothetical protein THASP1DRAFT_13333 [Thamnocephalis sphaerospora]|eukprot:RKP10099.1 hypothetical protein THASP1DRAFT_13333 [Thamnocephalis sphaerospora]
MFAASRTAVKDASNNSLLGPGSVIPEEEDGDNFGPGGIPHEISLCRPRIEVNVDAIRPAVQQYLSVGGGVGVSTGAAPGDPPGERTVVLMTARVAQKSYGAEKRFLCPPPTVMLLGSQWWTAAPSYNQTGQTDFAYHPPKVTITIPGDSGDQAGVLEWCSATGQSVMDGAAPTGLTGPLEILPVAGRCVAKHLYINDADEKRKRVEISIRVQTAAGHQLGKFDSRPIKVISKPSKKRQSVKNLELCIHHGTTVSLFNRVRSQTVSTKYLGVSSNATTQRWHCPGTFDPTVANAGDAAACFVARTDGWDPFVIWLEQANEAEATPIGYPPPPGVAMHPRRHVSLSQTANGGISTFPGGAQLIPVHYNQLVVLQCLTTGMVSPVMRVRKVEKGSIVTGGAEISEGAEVLGDPVSQLHKVAFEIYQPKNTPPFDGAPGTYLACLGDVVGVHPAVENSKRLISPPNTPTTATIAASSPLTSAPPHSPADLDGSGMAPTPGSPHWQQAYPTGAYSGATSPTAHALHEPVRSLKRRATQPVLAGGVHKSSPPVKSIRKVNSLGSFAASAAAAAAAAAASGSAWNEDVGDASVWTIVGTECVRYTFYHPGSLADRAFQFQPQLHLAPVTPVPSVHHVAISVSADPMGMQPDGSRPQQAPLVSLYGENFTADLSVWFGDRCSAQTEWRGRELITCYGPEPLAASSDPAEAVPERREVPLLLVRSDGVIFKTGRTLIV